MYSKIWHNPKWHNDPKMERNSQAGAKLSRQYSWTYKILDLEVADLITDCSENTSIYIFRVLFYFMCPYSLSYVPLSEIGHSRNGPLLTRRARQLR